MIDATNMALEKGFEAEGPKSAVLATPSAGGHDARRPRHPLHRRLLHSR